MESVIVDEKGEERPQGKAELFFAHLEPGEGVPKLFEPEELLKWLDHMHIYDIGQDEAEIHYQGLTGRPASLMTLL